MKKTLIIQVSNTFIQDFPFKENVTIKIPGLLVFQDLYKPKALGTRHPSPIITRGQRILGRIAWFSGGFYVVNWMAKSEL